MSKTANLVLFFVIAFIVNMLLMFLFIIAIFVGVNLLFGQNMSPNLQPFILTIGFFVSIVLTFLIYGWIMKWATARFNLEKHIPQLFKKKR